MAKDTPANGCPVVTIGDIQLGGRQRVTRDDVARRLRMLLNLPVELVLPAHGVPAARAALQDVLS